MSDRRGHGNGVRAVMIKEARNVRWVPAGESNWLSAIVPPVALKAIPRVTRFLSSRNDSFESKPLSMVCKEPVLYSMSCDNAQSVVLRNHVSDESQVVCNG